LSSKEYLIFLKCSNGRLNEKVQRSENAKSKPENYLLKINHILSWPRMKKIISILTVD
jgi:hypothetical protein